MRQWLIGLAFGAGVALGCVTLGSASPVMSAIEEEPSDEFDFLFAGDDDEEALAVLAKSLRKRGGGDWEVRNEGGYAVFTDDSGSFYVEAKMSSDKLDRVTISQVFKGKGRRNLMDRDCLLLINKVNKEQNVGQFWLDDDGDLWVLSSIAFRNRLAMEGFIATKELQDSMAGMVFLGNKDEFVKWFQ